LSAPSAGANGVINGAKMNSHYGSLGDYAYDSTGALPLTVYTGCCFKPEATELAQVWNSYRASLVNILGKVGVTKSCLFSCVKYSSYLLFADEVLCPASLSML